jgi:TonB-dependent starch-binding outer membrane protein SusC
MELRKKLKLLKCTSGILKNGPLQLARFAIWVIALIVINNEAFAQNAESFLLTGKVYAASNKAALPFVNVLVKGVQIGTVTDLEGFFSIEVKKGDVLVISFVGYLPVEVEASDKKQIEVFLIEDNTEINEIVVVGYGVMKKKLVTGANIQVKGEEIQKQSTVSPMQALQGNTPGMQITKTSGMPGEGFNVSIRGLGTIHDAKPLFIVDGLPLENIDNLNPADIESIDILKDAASAAIYGSRAANGVVLVTTKKGKNETRASVTYDSYYGVQNLYNDVELLNAQQYTEIMEERQLNAGKTPYDFANLVPRWAEIKDGTWKGTNWLDEITEKNAPIQNHTLNISGGGEKSVYSIGLGYTSQTGILGKPVSPQFERYTVRANTEHLLFVKDNLKILKVGENLTYSYSEKSGISIGNIYWNDVHNVLRASPFLPVRDENGEYSNAIAWNSREPNPVAVMDLIHGSNLNKNNNLTGNIYLELQPIENMTFRSSFGLNTAFGSYRAFVPAYHLADNEFRDYNATTHDMFIRKSWIFENTLSYNLKTAFYHDFTFLIGTSSEKWGLGEKTNGFNTSSVFNDFEHAYLDNTPTIDPALTKGGSSPDEEGGILSYFGRVNYNFKEKYMASAIIRADASSNFAKGNRWGVFPSISVGWVISEEEFLKSQSAFIDFLKFRASWGQNGNQAILPFQYLATISYQDVNYSFGTDKNSFSTGAFPDILPNPDVKWETSEQIDLGVDARFYGNRMSLAIDWYNKATKDWLVLAPTLASYGTGAPYINGGEVKNHGVELAFGWNERAGKLSYNIGATFAYNKNEVTRIANEEGIIRGDQDVLSENTTEISHARVNYPIGVFWGFKTDGIFQNETEVNNYINSNGDPIIPKAVPGDVRFVDLNKDGIIDDNDKTMIGDPNPDYIFGLSMGLNYKGFDFSLMLNGVAGNQIAKSYRSFADSELNNYTTDIYNRWHGEGTSTKMPRLTQGNHKNTQYISDLYIEDGNYLRLSNLTVGYDLKNIIKGLPIQQVRFYLSALNLYTFTKYSGMDPEIGYNGDTDGVDNDFASGIDLGYYPSPRTILAGVSLKF